MTELHIPVASDLYAIRDDQLRGTTVAEAVEVIWPGWRVRVTVPFVTPRGAAHAAVVLSNPDGTDGWASLTVRCRASPPAGWRPPVEEVLGYFERAEPIDKRMGYLHAAASVAVHPDMGLDEFVDHTYARTPMGAPNGAAPEDWPGYYVQWHWRALMALPDDAHPDMLQWRVLWALRGDPEYARTTD